MEFPDDIYMTKTGFTSKQRINMTLWHNEFKSTDSNVALDTYTVKAAYEATSGRLFDREILEWFYDYFGDWTMKEFERMNQDIRTKLKNFIQKRGVYVDSYKGKSISKAFVELTEMNRLPV